MKKTSTTNKKKNKKIQQQKNIQEAKEKKQFEEIGWISDEKSSENYKFAKKFNASFFQYFKNNMIMFELETPEEKKIAPKLANKIKKGLCSPEDFTVITHRDKKYLFKIEYLKKLNEMIVEIFGWQIENFDTDIAKDIIISLIINNPKPNGELNNFSIGFLGSVWIDMKGCNDKIYRLAFYNNGSKEYSKGFSPSVVVYDYD